MNIIEKKLFNYLLDIVYIHNKNYNWWQKILLNHLNKVYGKETEKSYIKMLNKDIKDFSN